MSAPIQKEVPKIVFTRYEIFMIAMMSILQFTVVLDFMILSPLGFILMPDLKISTEQFGWVVSAYAFSAGASGLLVAGFSDKFDRKKLLLFFYTGFVGGTAFCAMSEGYEYLLVARIVTGIFGGVIGSIGFAILTDLFAMEVRGRVMGFAQMAFAASQVLGIPIGLYLANKWGWHSTFWMIVAISIVIGLVILVYMKPINAHLKLKSDRNPVQHLWKAITNPDYSKGFLATTLLATGGFMLMPFGSAFSTNNLKIDGDSLPLLFGITGVTSIILGPFIGKLSDKIGKYKVFLMGSIISFVMVAIYTNLGVSPFWLVTLLNVILFIGITSRMISSQALISAVPQPQDRGVFMSINSSVMQLSGGIASIVAGKIVFQRPDGFLEHYPVLGYAVLCSITIAAGLYYLLDVQLKKRVSGNKKL